MAENKFIYSKISKGESPLVNRYVTKEEFFEHTSDKENPHEVTKAQVGLEDVVNKPMDSEVTEDSENYISSGAVKAYVDTEGGKIGSISVNNINQPIINKNVNLNVFPIDINEQFIRITDLESGIYRLKFNGTVYIYYNGYSSTDSYIIGDTQTLQIIQPVLTVIKGYNHDKDCDYWYWYLQANEFVKGFIDGDADDGSCGVAFQEPLVSGENIKTINGNSLLGNGNIQTEAYHTFPNTWHTGYGYNTQEFCESVEADTSAVAGTAYLGTLGCNDLPAGMGQAEAIVEIISTGANGKCMNLTLTSLTNKPYRWTYSYGRVNSHIRTVGWLGVSGQTIKVGSTTFALDAAIDLVAGSNVTVTPATSGTGAPKITIAATDTTYSNATTEVAGLMSTEDKTKLNGIESGAQVNVQADWNASSGDAQILNKPSIYTQSEINEFLILEVGLADIDPSHTAGGFPVVIPETAAKIKSFKYRLKFQKILVDADASEDDYMMLSPSDITNEYDDSINPETGEPYGTWTATYYSYISGVGAVFVPGKFTTVLFMENPDDLCICGFTSNSVPASLMTSGGNLYLGNGDGGTIGDGISYQEPLNIATSSTLGIVKSSTTGVTANRDYNVEVNNDGTMKVNVPWTDTTYTSQAAVKDGTAVSLCTTGEKYNWNHKQDLTLPTALTAVVGERPSKPNKIVFTEFTMTHDSSIGLLSFGNCNTIVSLAHLQDSVIYKQPGTFVYDGNGSVITTTINIKWTQEDRILEIWSGNSNYAFEDGYTAYLYKVFNI